MNFLTRAFAAGLVAGLLAVPALGRPGGGVVDSLHNLSASGPGRIKATDETEVCLFCHGAHVPPAAAQAQLWNREAPPVAFQSYASPRLDATAESGLGQPNGASRLCLSCHDGTLAIGALASRAEPVRMEGAAGGRMPAQARGFMGHDLSGSHPVSFRVTQRLVESNNAKDSRLVPLEAMRSDPEVHLDVDDRMQCTTCHDPHTDANFASSGVHFFRKPDFSELCMTCHEM